MTTHKRIETLSADFKGLRDAEKSYILGVSRALAFAMEQAESRSAAAPLATENAKKRPADTLLSHKTAV